MGHDYTVYEKEYMTSNVSLRSISRKYNISLTALARYAKAHDWEHRRRQKSINRMEKAIEKADDAQDEAWEVVSSTMRNVLIAEWKKVKKEKDGARVASLTRATKEAKEMGVFGPTLDDKKTVKELEALDKKLMAEISEAVTVTMEGCDEYAQ